MARALKFVFEIGLIRLFWKMTMLLMKALIDDGGSLMPYGFMVEDAKLCSHFFFIQLHYYHNRRESNNIVHRLDMQ